MGKPFDEAQYLGLEEKGSCPWCHLLKIEFREGNNVVCVVCGANGALSAVGPDGEIRPTWEEDSNVSSLTLKGKWKHLDNIADKLASERPMVPASEGERERWKKFHISLVKLPSAQRGLADI
jgi:hypothetical protein